MKIWNSAIENDYCYGITALALLVFKPEMLEARVIGIFIFLHRLLGR